MQRVFFVTIQGVILRKSVVFLSFLLVMSFAAPSFAAQPEFSVWIKSMRSEAIAKGVSPATANAALPDTMKPIARVIELDKKQPEKTKTFEQYLEQVVDKQRIAKGREKFAARKQTLTEIGKAYGVEPQVITALWGIETNYGQNTGGYEVINALATLAWDGRREAFFKDELIKAMKILDEGHIKLHEMKGSWAGAMGQSQFMPSSFLRFAEDYNKDGKRDIWKTEADVFASAANYLSKSGWKEGQPWGRAIYLPKHMDRTLIGIDSERTLQYWHDQGIRLKDGKTSVPFEGAYQGAVIQPGGAGTPAFIIYDNYRTIMKWNKSTYFATAVGTLSDKIKG